HTQILTYLHEESGTRHTGELAAQPGDDLVRRDLALGERFEGHEHTTGIDRTGIATYESDDILYRRIRADNRHELAEDLLHLLKRTALISLNGTDEPSRVLLGEEALRNDHVEIDVRPIVARVTNSIGN